MNSRKLAARALTLLPAVVIAVAAFVEVRAQAALVRTRHSPHALTFLVPRPAALPITVERRGGSPRARL